MIKMTSININIAFSDAATQRVVERGLQSITFQAPPNAPIPIVGDQIKLRQGDVEMVFSVIRREFDMSAENITVLLVLG
jgi:hypothetical protein